MDNSILGFLDDDSEECRRCNAPRCDPKLMKQFFQDAEASTVTGVVRSTGHINVFSVLENKKHAETLQELVYELSKFYNKTVSLFSFNTVIDATLFMGLPYSVRVEKHHYNMLSQVQTVDRVINIQQEEDAVAPDFILLDESALLEFSDALSDRHLRQLTVLTPSQLLALDILNGDIQSVAEAVAEATGTMDVGSHQRHQCPIVVGAKAVLRQLSDEIRRWFAL